MAGMMNLQLNFNSTTYQLILVKEVLLFLWALNSRL